jgi:hypothetical protein
MGTKLSLMNRITDYPLLLLAVAFFALWLSSRIGSSILKKRRKLEEDMMRAVNAMVIDFKPDGESGSRAEFSYHITPATISITGKVRLSVGKDLEAVLRKIEYWHQPPIVTFSITARHGRGAWHGV